MIQSYLYTPGGKELTRSRASNTRECQKSDPNPSPIETLHDNNETESNSGESINNDLDQPVALRK